MRSSDPETEIIVADGGSIDETVEIARCYNVVVTNSTKGRGSQLHAGASKATGNVFWFLHADSIPSPDAMTEIKKAFENPRNAGGNLTIRFDGQSRPARFMTWFYPHLRKIGLIYGDSAIFVRREVYESVGGFKPLPLFEDVDLLSRVRKKGQLVNLDAEIVTSSRRFKDRSFVPVFLRWVVFQCLYWFGVSPHWLAKYYYPDSVGVQDGINPSSRSGICSPDPDQSLNQNRSDVPKTNDLSSM